MAEQTACREWREPSARVRARTFSTHIGTNAGLHDDEHRSTTRSRRDGDDDRAITAQNFAPRVAV
jgi:hypothetical protein